MGHRWTLHEEQPANVVRWKCPCTAIIEFSADEKHGTPVSGTDAPPKNIDSFIDACPLPETSVVEENVKLKEAIAAVKRDPLFDAMDLATLAKIAEAEVKR